LAILGIDGSGKSSLSREVARCLSKHARACLISDRTEFFEGGEPTQVQPLFTEALREAIGRRAKSASSLRSYKIPKLTELVLRDHVLGEVKRWYAPHVVVSDGCPLLNIASWVRLYRDPPPEDTVLAGIMGVLSGRDRPRRSDALYDAFPELLALRRLHVLPLRCPEAVLFLDVDPAVSIERIRGRGETRQVHETEEKLVRLREGYRSVCRVLEREWQIPVRTLDGHRPLEEVTASALRALKETGVVGGTGPQASDGPRGRS
jgi:thymidylate kinase